MNNYKTVISVFCNNVHRSNHITHAILQSLASPNSNTKIAIITEPWIGTIRAQTQEKGTVNHPDWKCITPTNIREADVAIYYRKNSGLRVTPLPHYETLAKHTLPIQISIGENFKITLIAIYNSPSTFAATT